jgi:hypothetical protein
MPRFFEADVGAEAAKNLRRATMTGRPLGGAAWLKALEKSLAGADPGTHTHRAAGGRLAALAP